MVFQVDTWAEYYDGCHLKDPFTQKMAEIVKSLTPTAQREGGLQCIVPIGIQLSSPNAVCKSCTLDCTEGPIQNHVDLGKIPESRPHQHPCI